MKFLIPSYRRCGRVNSLAVAERMGFGADDVIIATQDEVDLGAYEKRYKGKAVIAFGPKRTAGGNRNNLLACLGDGELGLMVDDDVTELKISESVRHEDGRLMLIEDVLETFSRMKSAGACLGGIYPCDNHLFMQKSPRYKANALLTGAALFVVGGMTPMFDEEIEAMEDYELCARIVARGGNTLRNNRAYAKIPNNNMGDVLAGNGSDGGCKEMYLSGGHERSKARLLAEYGPILQVGKRGRSMRFRNV